MKQFVGKFKGTVKTNIDPKRLGRLEVNVPAVYGQGSAWALPCVPYAGLGVGFFALPPVGANVWVEFVGGSADAPVWVGCFWDEEAPGSLHDDANKKIFKTDTLTLTLDDTPGSGGCTIEITKSNPVIKVTLTAAGVEIVTGQQSIKVSSGSVAINGDALEVT